MTPYPFRVLASRLVPPLLVLLSACGTPEQGEDLMGLSSELTAAAFEGESMSFSTSTISVKSAKTASGGKYLAITRGRADKSISLSTSADRLSVRARAVVCGSSAPRMVVKFDDVAVHSELLTTTWWKEIPIELAASSGAHTVSIAVWNDATVDGCTVALHVDRVELEHEQTCLPTTCADVGATCGSIDDGCGNTVACGSCASGSTCGEDLTCRSAARFAGHIPGKFLLGMSCGGICAEKEAELGVPYGVHRQFSQWGSWSGIAQDIQRDHAQNRIPWISVKPPNLAAGWVPLARGDHDAEIRALAAVLKANSSRPVLLTLHHEPSNDGTEAEGANWARAYSRFHDVLLAEGALVNVAHVPIIGDWLFNPRNTSQDPVNWLKPEVMQRMPFLGIDLYENGSGDGFDIRLTRIIDWMASQGFPNQMVGIGEMGCTDADFPAKSAVQCLNENLGWAKANTDKIGVISYFNSTANSKVGVYWPLDESSQKLSTFRSWLSDPVSVP